MSTEYRGACLADGRLELTAEHSHSPYALMSELIEIQRERRSAGAPELTHIVALTPIRMWRISLFRDRLDRFSYWIGFLWGACAAMLFGLLVD